MTFGEFIAQGSSVAALLTALTVAAGVFLDKRKRRAEAGKTSAEGTKAQAEGEVALSGDYRAWAERADLRAERAEASAEKTRERAVEAEARLDHVEDELRKLRADYEDLLRRITECQAGPVCPVAQGVRSAGAR